MWTKQRDTALSQVRVDEGSDERSGSESGEKLLDSGFAFDGIWDMRGNQGVKNGSRVLA